MLDLIDTKGKKDIKSMTLEEVTAEMTALGEKSFRAKQLYDWLHVKLAESFDDLVNFMRDFRVVNKGDGTYINISQNQRVNENIKKLIGLTNLDALYLTEKEIENIFEFTMLVDD